MTAYLVKRLMLVPVTLLGVSLLVFVAVRILPGDAADQLAFQQAQAGATVAIDPEEIRETLGLDKSIPEQLVDWFGDLFRGDLGTSIFTGQPVMRDIKQGLPVTVELMLVALVISLFLGTPSGVISAVNADKPLDYATRIVTISGLSLPNFWLGVLVITLPALWWQWSPPVTYTPFFDDPKDNLIQFVIPGFILGLPMAAVTSRMTRSSLLEVLRQDYVRTAHAKGLRNTVVIYRHALKNALLPVVSIVGIQASFLFGGTLIIEQIFSLPGVGRLLVGAALQQDFPVVQGVVLFMATGVVIINLLTDIVYGLLDPRIAYG